MVEDLRGLAAQAPFRQYKTSGGRKMSVRMSGAGTRSWVTDKNGYRYDTVQPDGAVWPEIPASVLVVWDEISGVAFRPDSCLVNYYGEGSRMGMHQDKDEEDLDWPVVSISFGDDALFRVGGLARSDPTKSLWRNSGDVALLAGDARQAYHGIDRIKFRSSTLLERGGRINITLRISGWGCSAAYLPANQLSETCLRVWFSPIRPITRSATDTMIGYSRFVLSGV